jgi:hypothetical protein
MNVSLEDEIRSQQIRAGEQAVIENLERKLGGKAIELVGGGAPSGLVAPGIASIAQGRNNGRWVDLDKLNEPGVLRANILRGIIKLPPDFGELQPLLDRITRLEALVRGVEIDSYGEVFLEPVGSEYWWTERDNLLAAK